MEVGKYYKSQLDGHVIKVIKIVKKDQNTDKMFNKYDFCIFETIVDVDGSWISPCPIDWMVDYEEKPMYGSSLYKVLNK